MKKFRLDDCLFVLSTILFLAHQLLQKVLYVKLKMADSFLDPLVFMPICLYLLTRERRWFLKEPNYQLPIVHILCYVFLMILVSEIVFPALSDKFTADPLDALCFLAGAILFAATAMPDIQMKKAG